MWMKYDQNKENSNGRPNESGLLRCPMCKGRGYFEPSQVTDIKDIKTSEMPIRPNNAIKLPSLQPKSMTKQWQKSRYKYTLPAINNVKNITENKSVGLTAKDNNNSDNPQKKDRGDNFHELKCRKSRKSASQIKTGTSQGLSTASSNDSNFARNFIPSPRTPTNPSESVKNNITKLKTNNWNESLSALKEIVQISRFYPRLLEPSMVIVYRGLIFLLKSFRSVVVRTACQASNELFATMANTQRPEFDELVNLLLLKTADTNKVVRQDANEALDTMVINIPPLHSVRTITQKGITHKSPVVRGASARLLVCVVGVTGVEAVYNGSKETRGRIMNAAATYMQDGCQEVRNYGRRLMKMLMQHEDFEDVLQAEVNEVLLGRIEKTIITMKYKT